MPKQLNVDLSIRADTSQAKQNLEDLRQSLKNIGSTGAGLSLSGDIGKAVTSAKDLEMHLANAFNTKTGNIDLSKFQQSLQSSGQNATALGTNLLKAGVQGEKAFMQLQTSLSNANVQLTQSQGLLSNFLVSLKNTAQWQISSTILHGFMGAIRSAYNYAQDLNESLTNIRIVTGQTSDQMAEFAQKANKAAQALSTTTTAYTDAALIFYQQGLDDDAVEERTNATIKMAHATGDSATEVSSYMTAIWNNFDDGSESLEHYADVITALGATTASSSSEIASGLEKFASIADVTGLSYDYATSALATLVANTRQSADTIGNSLKTIFSRLQGVTQGETLDDDVDLNKYSKALKVIGVDILDANNEMKDLDTILDDTASKWDNLTNAQKMALAQTVAGVRQYSTFISLMDNWDDMQTNLNTAADSEGTLSDQADIYAESWEAASERVKSAAQAIYQDLLDDKFFIKISNGFASLLQGIDTFIKGMGGVKSILLLVSTLLIEKFSANMAQSIDAGIKRITELRTGLSGVSTSFKDLAIDKFKGMVTSGGAFVSALSGGKVAAASLGKELANSKNTLTEGTTQGQRLVDSLNNAASSVTPLSDGFKSYLTNSTELNNITKVIQQNSSLFTESQKEQLSIEQEKLNTLNQEASLSKTDYGIFSSEQLNMAEQMADAVKAVHENADILGTLQGNISAATNIKDIGTNISTFEELFSTIQFGTKNLAILRNAFSDTSTTTDDFKINLQNVVNQLQDFPRDIKAKILQTEDWEEAQNVMTDYLSTLRKTAREVGTSNPRIAALTQSGNELASKFLAMKDSEERFNNGLKNLKNTLNQQLSGFNSLGNCITTSISSFMSFSMAINSISNAFSTLGDSSASTGQKLTAIGMALTTSVRAFSGLTKVVKTGTQAISGSALLSGQTTEAMENLKKAEEGYAKAKSLTTAATTLETAATSENNIVKELSLRTGSKVTEKTEEDIRKALKKYAIDKLGLSNEEAQIFADKTLIATKNTKNKTLTNEIIKEELSTTAAQLKTDAVVEQTIAEETEKKAAEGATATSMASIAVFAAVAAAIALVVFAIVKMVQKSQQAKKDLEAAKKATEELSSAAEDAKSAADDLASAFDSYTSAKDTLDSCTRGTEEWTEALKDTNDAATELIDSINEMQGLSAEDYSNLYSVNNDGEIEVNQDVVDKAQALADQNANSASYAASLAAADEAEKQNAVDLSDLASSMYKNTTQDTSGTTLGGYAAENIDEYGNDNLYQEDVLDYLTDHFDELLNTSSLEDFKGALEDAGFVLDDVADSTIEGWQESIQNMANSADEASAKLEAASDLQVETALSGQDYGEAEKVYAEQALQATTDAIAESVKEEVQSANRTGQSDEYTDILQRLQDAGYDLTSASNGVQGSGNNRVMAFTGSDGEDGGVTYTADEIANLLAASEAMEEVGVNAEAAAEALDGADVATKDVATQIAANADIVEDENGNLQATLDTSSLLADMTDQQLGDLAEALSGITADNYDEEGNLDEGTQEAVAEALGVSSEYLDQYLDLLGSSLTGLIDSIAQEYGAETDENGHVTGGVTEESAPENKYQGTYSNNGFSSQTSNMTQSEKVSFDNSMEALEDSVSDTGVTGLLSLLHNSDLSGTDLASFTEGLSQIDFASEDATEQLQELYDEYGVAGDAADNFMSSVEEVPKVYSASTDAIQSNIASINDIIGDGLETGDIISADDYASLEEAGINVSDFFTETEEGTYQLTAAAQTFADVTKQFQQSDYFEQLNKYGQANEQARESTGYEGDLSTEYATAGSDRLDTILQYLNNMGYSGETSSGQSWSELTSTEGMSEDDVAGLIEAYQELQNNLSQTKIQLMDTATSLEELKTLAEECAASDDEYSQSLINLASNYDNCTEEIEAYQNALAGTNEEQKEAAELALEIATAAGEAAEKYDLEADELDSYAKRLAKTIRAEEGSNTTAEEAAKIATKLATQNMRLDRGLSNLNDNLDDYKKSLKNASKNSTEWSSTMDDLKTDLADIVNFDVSNLTDDFAEAALENEDLTKALNGDADAIQRLQTLAADSMIKQIASDLGETSTAAQIASGAWDYLKANMSKTLEAGDVDQTNLINSFNAMIKAGNMTKEQIEDALSGLHVSADVITTYNAQETKVPETTTEEWVEESGTATYKNVDSNGAIVDTTVPLLKRHSKTYTSGYSSAIEYVPSYEIVGHEGEGSNGETITTAFTAAPTPTASYSSTTAGKSSGSGSSGSSGSSKETKKASDEIERYHVINNKIEDTADALTELSNAKERAYGVDKIALMDQEIDKMEESLALQKELEQETLDWYEQDKAAIAAYGATFDENGTITNYEELVQKQLDIYNAALTDEAEEAYDTFKDVLDQYEETQDKVKTEAQATIDKINEIADAKLAKVQYTVEVRLDIEDSDLNWLEYELDRIEDKSFSAAKALGNLTEQIATQGRESNSNISGITGILEYLGLDEATIKKIESGEIDSDTQKLLNSLAKTMSESEVEALMEYSSALLENNQSIHDLWVSAFDKILEDFEDFQDEYEKRNKMIEFNNELAENYLNIIELAGKTNLGVTEETLSKLRRTSVETSKTSILLAQKQMEMAKKANEQAQKELAEAEANGQEEIVNHLQEIVDSTSEAAQDAQIALLEAIGDGITTAKEWAEAAIEEVANTFADAVAGSADSLDYLAEAMDRDKEIDDQTLDNYEKKYQLTKLEREIRDSANDTDNVVAQKELLKMAKQVNDLNKSDKAISQYELDALQKKYELKLAEQALEEAKNNKSTVSLVRDSEGNYGYVYGADQDKIDDAEQNFEDKLFAYEQLTTDYIKDLGDDLVELTQSYKDAVEALDPEDPEFEAKLAALDEWFGERSKFLYSETELAIQNNKELSETFGDITGDLLDDFSETNLAKETGFNSLEDYMQNLTDEQVKMSQQVSDINKQLNQDLIDMGADTTGELASEIEGASDEITSNLDEIETSIEDLSVQADEYLKEMEDAFTEWKSHYDETFDDIVERNENIAKSFNELKAAWYGYDELVSEPEETTPETSIPTESEGGNSGETGDSTSTGTAVQTTNPYGTFSSTTGTLAWGSSGNSVKSLQWALAQMGYFTGTIDGVWGPLTDKAVWSFFKANGLATNSYVSNSPGYYQVGSNSRKKFAALGFDTGGYTGEWGRSGRLAMLHQKELVLNENDTKNFLAAVDTVRALSQAIDLNAIAAAAGPAIQSNTSPLASGIKNALEQVVHITAEFPDVSDRNEILAAFDNVINLASQYANREY